MSKSLLHVHTEYSPDSNLKLQDLYRYLTKYQIDTVTITDHNTIEGALEFQKQFGNSLNVIIGEEIMTKEGEVIGLFLKRKIKPFLTVEETIDQIKEQGGIVYIPHPNDRLRQKSALSYETIKKYIMDIDCIEVFNGRTLNLDDFQQAKQICDIYDVVSVYGCDAHTVIELKSNIIKTVHKLDRDNILDELKTASHLNPKIQKNIHIYTKYVKMKKIIKMGRYDELYRIINRKYKRIIKKISK